MILFARWGGLAAGILALIAAMVASARVRRRRPSLLFSVACAGAATSGFVACAAPYSPLSAPVVALLVASTLAVIYYALPALVILGLTLIAAQFFAAGQRPLRTVQLVAMWFAFVLVPGCAGVGLISQFPVCLG
jgi:hypothetical protein